MATISNQFRQSILDSVSTNIGSLLIYNPLLGKDYSITPEQIEMRKNLNFNNVVNYEVLATIKNQYKRYFPNDLVKKNTSSYSSDRL
jgi:hypothetical protein